MDRFWNYNWIFNTALIFITASLETSAAEYVRTFEVSELLPIGSTVGYIGQAPTGSALPPPPPYLIIFYQNGVDTDLIINDNTGEIKTKVALDRERKESYTFMAWPVSGDGPNIRVTIKLMDENDHAPQFPNPNLGLELAESTPRGAKISLPPAKDKDLDINNTQKYEIVSGNVNNAFRLSSPRGKDGVLYLDLQVNGMLDRETVDQYSLIIEAYDGGIPPKKGTMVVNITILDVNDNQPVFNQSRYFATALENAPITTSVLQVYATDADIGSNGQVSYDISRRQSDPGKYFIINPITGVIAVNKPLDFETKQVHELVVIARDNGTQPLESTAFVSIRVVDVNDNKPTINLIFLSDDGSPKVTEDAKPGEYVARVSVNDPDMPGEHTKVNVSLEGGNGQFGLTTTDNIIFLITIEKPLDREKTAVFNLTVTAKDSGHPPLHATTIFQLHITDKNDNTPEFSNAVYYASVLEGADPGTSVMQLIATDRDDGNNSVVTYSIWRNESETKPVWFQVDPHTGLVTTRMTVDCETDPQPQIIVIASDNGDPPLTSTAKVIITVRDVNDNEPVFDHSFYNISVKENESVGKCILQVTATDPDCGINAHVNYTIGVGPSFQNLKEFKVRPLTGEICIVQELNHEFRISYEFPVVATDQGGLSTTAMVKVYLIDVNDNYPIFYPTVYNVSLRENTTQSTMVVMVSAEDADSGNYGMVTYALTPDIGPQLFRINSKSGEIFLTSKLSKRTSPYHLLVVATDGGGLSSVKNADVFISVIDPNESPPIFGKVLYNFSVFESVTIGATIGVVQAKYSDKNNRPVSYSLYSGDPANLFIINPVSGRISNVKLLDREKQDSVLLNIQAQSGNPPVFAQAQVNITILDVNDNAPRFGSSSIKVSIPENINMSALIYSTQAVDDDIGSNSIITYQFLKNPQSIFKIDGNSGFISLQKPLDYEKETKYDLIVMAFDHGSPSLSSSLNLTIDVQDVNDHFPIFNNSNYHVNVSESTPVNTRIAQVNATDQDTGNNARLTYRLKSSNSTEQFGIFPNDGFVYLRDQLDREIQNTYILEIIATDHGHPVLTGSTTLTIQVMDINDNAPIFSQKEYRFQVLENQNAETLVGVIKASDKDLGNNATIIFTLYSTTNGSFWLDSKTGRLLTKKPLDREEQATYEFTVEAKDQGIPPLSNHVTVHVIITDVNDNKPNFILPVDDSVSVYEEMPKGTEVVQVKAIDSDDKENGSIIYSFLSGKNNADEKMFFINSSTGFITMQEILDHETKRLYNITIVAKDMGNPPQESQRSILVNVLDINDNRPVFPNSSVTFEIIEGVSIGIEIGKVQATDRDAGENGRVSYTINSGNSFGVFDIHRKTGKLFTQSDVDYEMAPTYTLKVKALDNSAKNPKSSIITVNIIVRDINDNAPTFRDDPIFFSIPENVVIGSMVWNFSATDIDSGLNGLIQYTITQQTPVNAFRINSTTGIMTTAVLLDYEVHPEYTVVVTATDQAFDINQRKATSVTSLVIIEDYNDNAPVFMSRTRVDIMEDEPIGYHMLHIIGVDQDSRDNGRVMYHVESGNEAGNFALEPVTGLLSVSKNLDRENIHMYVLNITAFDHGKPAKTATQQIFIYIEDVSDNPPHFQHSTYIVNVTEDVPVGTIVEQLKATDKDIGTNGFLTYVIPQGIANDKFTVNASTGQVFTASELDRETQASYVLTAYVRDGAFPAQYDTATILVNVLDVNDNAPEFKDPNYELIIPENSEFSLLHTVVAIDKDSGKNGNITYKISDGNIGNKFNIDPHTGELFGHPLDREAVTLYNLVIIAEDKGNPSLSGTCKIDIQVLDLNDNDPQFSQNKYTKSFPENIPINSTVLVVQATDADAKENKKITYSLTNESQWLFRINEETGVITTAGLFDREKKAIYVFEVRATDGGRYDPRSEKAQVVITVEDVNDNKPVFNQIPFTAEVSPNHPPGQYILQVVANDKDIGLNAQVVYSFAHPHPKFNINPDSGVVTAKTSLAMDSGYFYHLEVIARDQGKDIQHSSTGLVEIRVGESTSISTLRFANSTYNVYINENASPGTPIVHVTAQNTPSSSTSITYSFASGNEDNTFDIDAFTGVIKVADNAKLDYELYLRLRLIVVAQADGNPPLYGYTTVWVNLRDENDNIPRFSQERYSSSVWEGNNRGTYVMQVSATDDDVGKNGYVQYSIIDGNHDDAFIIDPPFSGIVKTNIVLDREIRDVYRLTIIATDDGSPQMTGTCMLRITIVDINDNAPVFPAYTVVDVNEGAEIGSVLAIITANDVDLHPSITYDFAEGGNPNNMFSIDRYEAKIILDKGLDREKQAQYILTIQASDTVHTAETNVTVNLVDENDNAPIFNQQSYQIALPELTVPGYSVITVNASDADVGENSRITYSMGIAPVDGFYIDEDTGTVYTNKTVMFNPMQPIIQLVITGRDHGTPSLAAVVAVRIQVTDVNNNSPKFRQDIYSAHVSENASRGSIIITVMATDVDEYRDNKNVDYSIVDGNRGNIFEINTNTGDIILLEMLDRETVNNYALIVMATDRGIPARNSTAEVIIYIDDVNDNAPYFNQSEYLANVSELSEIGKEILQVSANDKDDGINAEIMFDFTSGNDNAMFRINRSTGIISLVSKLDFEKVQDHRLVVRASDRSTTNPMYAVAAVIVNVEDENDNTPFFPVLMYLEFVPENAPVGTTVFVAHANDADKGMYGKLNYSITEGDGKDKYKIDSQSGIVTTDVVFDYEAKSQYHFIIMAMDIGGRFTTVQVQVDIESRDEYQPKFTKSQYVFTIPGDAKPGSFVGQVEATDEDGGLDGKIVYRLRENHPFFNLNDTSGVITVKKSFENEILQRRRRRSPNTADITLYVSANSGRDNSKSDFAVVHVTVNYSASASAGSASGRGGLDGLPLGLVIAFSLLLVILIIVIIVLRLRNSKRTKQSDHRFDGSFETIDIRSTSSMPPELNHFPPRYNDIAHYDHGEASNNANITTSDVSDQSHSASSGRGSAEEGEDVEDEEIRMINEGPMLRAERMQLRGIPDSGIQQDDDNMSDISVHNTQEYLARLGIPTHHSEPAKGSQDIDKMLGTGSIESIHMFDEEGGGESDGMDIGNLIYAKLNEVGAEENDAIMDGTRAFGFGDEGQPSMNGSLSSIVHSEEELTGSYNWDYLLDWGPQYQPLAHVFAEIARLKDDTLPMNKDKPLGIPHKSTLNPKLKTIPPPLLTNVAPRSIAPVALSSGQTSHVISLPSLPRSPISHESSFTSPALSPNFSPSLSPLATRSPSVSPLVTPGGGASVHGSSGHSTPHHSISHRSSGVAGASSGSETELRI